MRKELIEYLRHLIDCYSVDNEMDLNEIDNFDKGKLIAYCIDDDNRDLTYCLMENEKYDDIVSELIINLVNGNYREGSFMDLFLDSLFNYYKPRCEKVIKEELDEIWRDKMREAGAWAEINSQTGETEWKTR